VKRFGMIDARDERTFVGCGECISWRGA